MEDGNPMAAVAEDCNINPYEHMKIAINPDGTLTRGDLPTVAANSEPLDSAVTFKDIPLNTTKNTYIRVYQPQPQPQPPGSIVKLPVIIFYHGGGFIVGSISQDIVHRFCSNMCAQLRVIVVSAGYRLAPEYRLPAAYEDAMEAIFWLKNKAPEAALTSNNHDLSRCFIMGDSAGSNIAYHVGLRAALVKDEILPLKIAGLILHEPFFGGLQRTESELRLANDQALPLSCTDLMWELSLPVGSNRDHFYCNPMMVNENGDEGRSVGLLRRCSVTGWEGDLLIDRMKMFVKMLEEMGVDVVARFGEGGFHGVEAFDSSKSPALFTHISDFISLS